MKRDLGDAEARRRDKGKSFVLEISLLLSGPRPRSRYYNFFPAASLSADGQRFSKQRGMN